MPTRDDYERRRGPKHRPHNQPVGNVKGEIKCVLSVTGDPSKPPTHVGIRVDVDFLAVPVIIHITDAEQLDDLINCMVSARNNVWPNN